MGKKSKELLELENELEELEEQMQSVKSPSQNVLLRAKRLITEIGKLKKEEKEKRIQEKKLKEKEKEKKKKDLEDFYARLRRQQEEEDDEVEYVETKRPFKVQKLIDLTNESDGEQELRQYNDQAKMQKEAAIERYINKNEYPYKYFADIDREIKIRGPAIVKEEKMPDRAEFLKDMKVLEDAIKVYQDTSRIKVNDMDDEESWLNATTRPRDFKLKDYDNLEKTNRGIYKMAKDLFILYDPRSYYDPFNSKQNEYGRAIVSVVDELNNWNNDFSEKARAVLERKVWAGDKIQLEKVDRLHTEDTDMWVDPKYFTHHDYIWSSRYRGNELARAERIQKKILKRKNTS